MGFYRYKYTLLVLVSVFLSGCKKFDKEETVPSYIQIKNCILSCDSATQGSTRHKISDVWVDVDGNRQGTYELPVTFPVLYEGSHTLQLRGGIKINGIGASRMPYPFLSLLTIDTILTPDHILELTPVYTYNTYTVFKWREDFENNGFTLNRMAASDTTLDVKFDSLYPLQHFVEYNLDTAHRTILYESSENFTNFLGSVVFLELDYQCNYPMTIGLILNKNQQSITYPILVLNPYTSGFNHIYIDLGTTLLENPDAISFKVFFGSSLESGYQNGYGRIDNIKLLHF